MAKLKFEEALGQLEKIVDDLESGDLSLDLAMKKYEEGQVLSSICGEKLKMAEKKIETLKKKCDNTPEWEPYDKDESQTRNAPADNSSETDEDLLF